MARSLQDKVSELNKNDILPALSSICDKLVSPGQRIRIDKLELDLGSISPDKFDASVRDRILRQFEEQITSFIIKHPEVIETDPVTQDIQAEEGVLHDGPSLSNLDLVCYFIEHGNVPWWAPTKELQLKQVISDVISQSPEIVYKRIQPLLRNKNVRLRIVELLSEKQFFSLIDPADTFNLQEVWKEIISFLKTNNIPKNAMLIGNLQFFEAILNISNEGLDNTTKQKKIRNEIISLLFQIIRFANKPVSKDDFILKLKSKKILAAFLNLQPQEITEIIDQHFEKRTEETRVLIEEEEEENQQEKHLPDIKVVEEIYLEVKNAGLVILWPYLQMFFKELNLLNVKQFIDEPASWKAVHLLNFLATGNTTFAEEDCALNKILCGLAVTDFVPNGIEITESDKAECDNLLQSVIKNWTALKNSSVRGLQEGFLQRNGLIKEDPQGFIVEIERTSIDLLIDKLTWTISIIKLPWNKSTIHVKW